MKRSVVICCLFAAAFVRAAINAPTDVPGCVLWLDAADADTYDGSPVAQWRDKSGLGHHLAQSDSAKRPTVSATALSGKNVLTFNGSQWLAGDPVLRQGSTNFSFFGVWKKLTSTDTGVLFEQYGTPWTKGTRCSFMAAPAGFGFTGQNVDLRPVPYTTNVWRVSGVEYDGCAANNIVFWDSAGVYGGTLDSTALQIGATAAKVGANISAGECLNGALAEIVVYEGELSEIDRNRILYYLQDKWGVGDTYMDAASIIDFSHGRLPPGWVGIGDAFSTNQPYAYFPSASFNNTGPFIDSYFGGVAPDSDAKTGVLTGNEFAPSNNTVRLRVGGGYQETPFSACQVRLERKTASDDWEIIRKATGTSANPMSETRWNLYNLMGQTLRFTAVDENTGTWGCTRLDNIRFLDEPAQNDFTCLFTETNLPSYLLTHKPYGSPLIEVTVGNTLRFACSGSYNAWGTLDQAPKVLFQTFSPDTFVLQTHVTAFSYQGPSSVHAGLALIYEKAGTNAYDYLLFGPFASSGKVRIERTGVGTIGSEWSGNISNVYLRVTGAKGKLTFLCSPEGTNWTTIASTSAMQGAALLNAGLFEKTYNTSVVNANSEFDSLAYGAATTNSPVGVPGCVLWLDADDASTIVTGAVNTVLQWRDKSGFGNHVAQNNLAEQPVVTAANLNGRTTLTFDGGDYLAGPPVWQQGETNFTVFAVWRRNTADGSQVIVEQAGVGNGARASIITRSDLTYGFCGESNDAYSIGWYAFGEWNLSGLEYNGQATNNIYLDLEGTTVGATIDTTYKENVGVTGVRVGCKLTMGDERLQGCVAEVIMFNRTLTAAERYNVLDRLQQKWGLEYGYYGNPADIPAHSLTLDGNRADLHGRSETYAALAFGDGSVATNGALVCGGTVEASGLSQVDGDLTLEDGVVISNAQTGCVEVNGTLTLGGAGTLSVVLPEGSRAIRTTLFRFDTLIGEANLDDWQIVGVPASWNVTLTVDDGAIVLKAALVGTVFCIQ